MKALVFLFITFTIASFTQAQSKDWELVKDAPDTCRISPAIKIISTDDAVYLYQQDAGLTFVSKSEDGIHFTSIGTLDASLGPLLPMFSWRNEIYLRTPSNATTYYKSSDGIHFQTFLPKDRYNNHLIPLTFGVVRDTLVAYCSHFQKGNTDWRDSLYYVDGNNNWTASYGKLYTETYTTICMQEQLLLNSSAGYLDFYSLRKAPRVIPKTGITFNAQRWSAGQYIVSYDANHNFNGTTALLLTDIKAKTTTPLPPPQNYLETDEFSLLVMPDSSLILKNRKQVVTPQNPSATYVFIYQTYDWGNHWTVIDSFPQNWRNKEYLSVYTYKNDWFISNTLLPFRKSIDKGQNWNSVMLYGTRWNTGFVSADGKMALNGTHFSNDDGKTWQLYADAFPQYTPDEIFWRDNQLGWFFKNNSYAYYQIKPGTTTITSAGGNGGSYFKEAQKVQNQVVYLYRGGYADFNSGLFYKLNQTTQQWSQISDLKNVLRANPPMYLLCDGQNLYYYDVENNVVNGMFKSSDIGQTWTLLPMPALLVPDQKPIYSFYDDRSNHVYMSIREANGTTIANTTIDTLRIFKITPGGYVPVAAHGFAKQPMRQGTAHPAFQNLISFSASGAMYSWSQDTKKTILRLFKSMDQGENWEQINTDQILGTVLNIGEDLNGRLYISTVNGLFREKEEDVITSVQPMTTFNSSNIVVYPNPASASITVSTPGMNENIQILDLLGHVVIHTTATDHESHIDISPLTPGVYVIKTEALSGKLIIK